MARHKTKKVNDSPIWYVVAVSRILLGFIFLWAFLDKLFGLHYSTPTGRAWIHGGSPTTGFLSGVHGPFSSFFHSMAGHTWADWLFMIGLAGIGVALILGIAVRVAVVAGSALLALMWAASLPMTTNPVIDEHVMYIMLLWIIFFGYRNQAWSLGAWWRRPVRWRWLW